MLTKKSKKETRYYFSPSDNEILVFDLLSAQSYDLLGALRRGPMTTGQIQTALHILHPAARVAELTRAGYYILTNRVVVVTPKGDLQRTVRYELIPWYEA
jgi:hypothetical protein